jgi:PDZ domain-containing protein
MAPASSSITKLLMRPSPVKISLNLTWLVAIPVGMWAIATFYVPIFGAFLNPAATWFVTLLIAVLIGLSLLGHILAHVSASRLLDGDLPARIPLFLFGDAAQVWPSSTSPRREALAALAGPLFNLILAGAAYGIWNAQINTYLNLSMLFLCGFNLWLVFVNLTPGLPLDGGRLAKALLQSLARPSAAASGLSKRLGYLIAGLLSGWGIFLILQRSRFSWETGLATLLFALLLVAGLWKRPPLADDEPATVDYRARRQPLRILIVWLLILGMLGVPASLLLTNDGLEAPGLALAVEPMVEVSPQHRFAYAGSFILTTVISQAPIIVGEWLVGQLSPAVKLVPPASIVPDNTTPQELAKQGFQMLDQSTTTAVVVGLRLAGYQATMTGKGVEVVGLLPDSPAQGSLQSGDVITSLNGTPIRTTSDLVGQIRAQEPSATVQLTIERNQRVMEVAIRLMPPTEANTTPRIGITIEPAGFDVKLPFPVQIRPEKIVGGPSAGLMFTLAVYNALTPQDLTGGRKIAGTGTISLDGTVGPIGGVEQKVAAAEAAGAEYFLSPVENYENARAVAQRIKVVKIATVDQAVEFLRGLSLP